MNYTAVLTNNTRLVYEANRVTEAMARHAEDRTTGIELGEAFEMAPVRYWTDTNTTIYAPWSLLERPVSVRQI
jgi:hypothetical protein